MLKTCRGLKMIVNQRIEGSSRSGNHEGRGFERVTLELCKEIESRKKNFGVSDGN